MRFALLFVLLWICACAYAMDPRVDTIDETRETPATLLRVIARDHIRRVSTDDVEAKWSKKMDERVAERAEAQNLSREQVAQAIFQDWAIDNRKHLTDPVTAPAPVILEACRLVDWFTRNALSLPPRLYNELKSEHVDLIRTAIANR